MVPVPGITLGDWDRCGLVMGMRGTSLVSLLQRSSDHFHYMLSPPWSSRIEAGRTELPLFFFGN